MKKLLNLVIILGFLSVGLSEANGWFWDKNKAEKEKPVETKEKQPVVGETKIPVDKKTKLEEEARIKENKAQEEARKAKRALIEQKRKEINNIEWEIELVPLSGKGKTLSETVVFKNMQVSFVEFGKKGFTPSNFSLKVQDDKILVWETMQTSEKSGVVFWRGEITPDLQKMRGVVSYQISDKKKEDYSFISINRKIIP